MRLLTPFAKTTQVDKSITAYVNAYNGDDDNDNRDTLSDASNSIGDSSSSNGGGGGGGRGGGGDHGRDRGNDRGSAIHGHRFTSNQRLLPEAISIAEVLGPSYKSARFGKWQLGNDTQGFSVISDTGRQVFQRTFSVVQCSTIVFVCNLLFVFARKQTPLSFPPFSGVVLHITRVLFCRAWPFFVFSQ
jgi:hypothetical protein